jgi:hypothetical protein
MDTDAENRHMVDEMFRDAWPELFEERRSQPCR